MADFYKAKNYKHLINTIEETMSKGEIKEGGYHPMAESALNYIRRLPIEQKIMWLETLASTAIEGNETAEICHETLRRIMEGEPVSDRYVLGLAWFLTTNWR